MKSRLISAVRSLTIGFALSLGAMILSGLLILNTGRIAALFGADEKIVSVLSQLQHARLISPWRLLISGAAVLATCIEYLRQAQRRSTRIILATVAVLLWLAHFAFMLLGASVNEVPVHTVLRILMDYLKGGALNVL